MQDPRVERLEQEIESLRSLLTGFISTATNSLNNLTRGVEQVNGHIADLKLEVGDVPDHKYRRPDRPTLNSRMELMENESAATKIAHAALSQSREAKAHAWTVWQKAGLFAFAAMGAIAAAFSLVEKLIS